MKRTSVDASMQICALFVFGCNALDVRKFGLDFRTRPSKGDGSLQLWDKVYVCVCERARVVCECVFCLCCVTVNHQDSGHSTLIVVRHN